MIDTRLIANSYSGHRPFRPLAESCRYGCYNVAVRFVKLKLLFDDGRLLTIIQQERHMHILKTVMEAHL